MPEKVAFDRMVVQPDRIEAWVRINDQRCRFTSPALVAAVIREFPTLPYHACHNEKGPTFLAVMDNTSVPHLLEHMIIDIQTHEHDLRDANTRPDQAIFTGTTQWSAEDENVAIVRVSFLDDLVGLAAFKKALNFINNTLDALYPNE